VRRPRGADEAFAANVKRLRAARELSLRDLAANAGVGHTVLYRIEHGQAAQLGHAVAIAAGLGVQLADMLGGGPCGTCFGRPPAGFACLSCGAWDESPATEEGS